MEVSMINGFKNERMGPDTSKLEENNFSMAMMNDKPVLISEKIPFEHLEHYKTLFQSLYKSPPAIHPVGVENRVNIKNISPQSAGGRMFTIIGILSNFIKSGGETLIAKLSGVFDMSVGERDLQMASMAISSTGQESTLKAKDWDITQRSKFIRGASIIGEQMIYHKMSKEDAKTAMEFLMPMIDNRGYEKK
jgi:hypothetical protein